MTQTQQRTRNRDMQGVRVFALLAYLYSWPIFIVVDAWLVPRFFEREEFGAGVLTAVFGHMMAMAGPALAAIVLWRRFHKEPMPRWEWGRFRHYALAATAMLALWTVPGLVGLVTVGTFHFRSPIEPFAWVVIGTSFSVGWLAGLGEELGWTAYLLPRLAPHIGKSRALVVAGAIRGLWHWPVLVGPLVWEVISGEKSLGLVLGLSSVFAFQLIVSNALFGSLFGWVWYKTESLPLMGWLHQWFDATRDVTSLLIVGFGTSLWFKTLWAIPFYLVAGVVLMQVARGEGANLWTLAPPLR
ncbi:MAG: CPBP family intramembrane glutamic endopeptidase, partial [Dehalococcoidia bacterium]